MTRPTKDLDQLKALLDQMGERLANDREYREQLRTSENHAAALHASGISTAMLVGVMQEAGAEESELAGLDLSTTEEDPTAIMINGHCVTPRIGQNSCSKITLTISVGTNPPKHPGKPGS